MPSPRRDGSPQSVLIPTELDGMMVADREDGLGLDLGQLVMKALAGRELVTIRSSTDSRRSSRISEAFRVSGHFVGEGAV
jgi:hypothetical protein